MSKPRNNVAVAMQKRYGSTNPVHRDRRMRRSKDARKSWKKEWE